ncbi:MAG: hypothetical protein ACFHHU_12065 [Porticoccaceae bacterium]
MLSWTGFAKQLQTCIALLPGSRSGEIEKIAPVFLETAELMLADQPDLHFLIPAAHDRARQMLEKLVNHKSQMHVVNGRTRQILARSSACTGCIRHSNFWKPYS